MERILLQAGALRLEIAPAFGAAITSLRWADWEVLRAAPALLSHPFEAASFVMLPYANRIAEGRVRWGDVDTRLPANIEGERHPLHGVGIAAAWQVSETALGAVALRLDHAGSDAWPWAFEARQRVVLDAAGADFGVSVINRSGGVMPLGIGFHPYFNDARQAVLRANLSGAWGIDAQQLPTIHGAPVRPWAQGHLVQDGGLIDHCHDGWDGVAVIAWPEQGRQVRILGSSGLNRMHIYSDPRRDFFCIEPVSHRPDAINTDDPGGHGLIGLAPGESVSMQMRLEPGDRTEFGLALGAKSFSTEGKLGPAKL